MRRRAPSPAMNLLELEPQVQPTALAEEPARRVVPVTAGAPGLLGRLDWRRLGGCRQLLAAHRTERIFRWIARPTAGTHAPLSRSEGPGWRRLFLYLHPDRLLHRRWRREWRGHGRRRLYHRRRWGGHCQRLHLCQGRRWWGRRRRDALDHRRRWGGHCQRLHRWRRRRCDWRRGGHGLHQAGPGGRFLRAFQRPHAVAASGDDGGVNVVGAAVRADDLVNGHGRSCTPRWDQPLLLRPDRPYSSPCRGWPQAAGSGHGLSWPRY